MSINAAQMSIQEAREAGREAYVEAILLPVRSTYGQFDTKEVVGYRCRLRDRDVGLDLMIEGNTPRSASMRALGIVTGCYWWYANYAIG